ncbi:MAG TPA: response regulator [Dyadobacter sp.]|jgi:CheY-like chemotaxis protein|nr:response regulator [Dyadobacter sp.]
MKTIYLTDDDEDDRMLLRYAIEKAIASVRIIELDSGDALIRLLEREPYNEDDPAIIIMDMNMPRMNGLETLRLIKKTPSLTHLPVVMISTSSNSSLIRESYDTGVNAFLQKPITESDFIRLAQAIDVCFLNTSHPACYSEGKMKRSSGSIVVIEDNEDHLFFIERALKENMAEVHIKSLIGDRKVAQELRNLWDDITPSPKLILVDLYLPDRQTGLEVLVEVHQLLADRQAKSVPVIIFTFSHKTEDRKASYANNANAYITKDVNALNWKNDLKNLENFWWDTVAV